MKNNRLSNLVLLAFKTKRIKNFNKVYIINYRYIFLKSKCRKIPDLPIHNKNFLKILCC